MKIQLTIEMEGLRSTKQAREVGENIADHLFDTFNDDNSIKCIEYKVIPTAKGKPIAT